MKFEISMESNLLKICSKIIKLISIDSDASMKILICTAMTH